MVNLTVEPLRIPMFHGVAYKKVKSFRSERKAKLLVSELKKKCCSKRFPPEIDKVRIGLGLGYLYRVCIPKEVKI